MPMATRPITMMTSWSPLGMMCLPVVNVSGLLALRLSLPDFDTHYLPIQHGCAGNRVHIGVVQHVIDAGASMGRCRGLSGARAMMTPAVGDGNHARHDVFDHFNGQDYRSITGSNLRLLTIHQAPGLCVCQIGRAHV